MPSLRWHSSYSSQWRKNSSGYYETADHRASPSLIFGMEVLEFSEEELLHADEVMVTDTNSEIVPVIKVNDIIIGNGARGEITKKIQMLYNLIEEKCGKL